MSWLRTYPRAPYVFNFFMVRFFNSAALELLFHLLQLLDKPALQKLSALLEVQTIVHNICIYVKFLQMPLDIWSAQLRQRTV